MEVTISIFGDTQFSRELTRVGDNVSDMDPVFRSVFSHIRQINAEHMLSLGVRGGTPWEPLKPATIKSKARAEFGATPGVGARSLDIPHPEWPEFRTEALFKALTYKDDDNNEEIYGGTWAVFRVTGEPGDYGPPQHHGSEAHGLPARPLFVLTTQDRKDIVDEIAYFVFKGGVRNFVV